MVLWFDRFFGWFHCIYCVRIQWQHSFFWPSGTPGIAHPGQGGIQPRTPGTVGQVFWKFESYKLSAIWYSSPPQAEIFTFQLCPQRFSFAPRAVLQHKTAVFSFECLLSTPGNAHPGQGLDFSTHPGQRNYGLVWSRIFRDNTVERVSEDDGFHQKYNVIISPMKF